MNQRLDHISSLAASMRLPAVDLDALYVGKNDITPLAAVELYLDEQLKIRTEKQNLLRRKRANLPSEKNTGTV